MTISVLLFFILGLTLISYGANILVRSTEDISKKYNISYFLSSFIFIGLATSSPEIFISVISSIDGKSNIAIGNALGSNIANIALVFALSYLFFKKGTLTCNRIINKELQGFILFLIIISLVIIPLLVDGMISFNESLLLLSIFFILLYLYKRIYYVRSKEFDNSISNNYMSGSRILVTLLFGLAVLLVGTEIFLNSSISFAKEIGISEYIIGLSITAIGTSIPELASSIESARKKNFDFVVGNILGSNIFNIAIVISISGLFTLIPSKPLDIIDLSRDMIMILITIISFYTIIKNYNYLATKILCVLLLILFITYQISLYGINI